MAHLRVELKTHSRKAGVSAVGRAAYRSGAQLEEHSAAALAAYRAGEAVTDQTRGRTWDFSRRTGIETFIAAPAGAPAWVQNPSRLWSEVDVAEHRKDARIAREVLVSLPHELSAEGRRTVAHAVADHLVATYGIVVQASIHDPPKHGDERNHHVHLLCSTRALGPDGRFGAKTRALDVSTSSGREVEAIRQMVATTINTELEREGLEARVDARSIKRQALEIKAKEARQDRERAASARDKVIRLQALQAWRAEDLDRRLAQDPMVWTRATKVQARDREEREIRAETAARADAKRGTLGRQLTAREVRSIRQAVEQRRSRQAKRQAPPVKFWTREELQRTKAAARLEDLQAKVDKPKRIAQLEAQIRKRGHLVQAVAARLEAGRAVDRDGTRPPATLASVRQMIQRARAAERTGMRR